MSYFWQIFQRLGLRVDFGFPTLTLTAIPIAILSPPPPSWRSVRVTAWQKATGYEFFITFSHCNKVWGKRGEGKAKAKGETEIEADRGHYVYVSFVELFRIGKAPNRNCIN